MEVDCDQNYVIFFEIDTGNTEKIFKEPHATVEDNIISSIEIIKLVFGLSRRERCS